MKPLVETRLTKAPEDLRFIQALVETARARGETWALSWTPSNVLDEFEKAQVFLAILKGAPAGFLFVRPPGPAWEIMLVAVHSNFRGRGVLEALVEGCGASPLHLEVRADNQFAITAYERLGFRAVGRRPRYYQDGVDAVLYSRD